MRLALALIAPLLLLAAGCATSPLQYQHLEPADGEAQQAELTDTPFYPQTAYQCGPSALATVLQASGVNHVTPDSLADQVYLPGRKGSLQTELLAATRRSDRVPYRLEPELTHLLEEVRAGNPVLVLQNLRLPNWPQWHYAVVVGFDLEAQNVILRSGTEQRRVESLRRFERSWQMGDYWAMVVTEPDQTPATATATRFLQAVVPLEQQQRYPAAIAAYNAAAERWPENPASRMGLGNIAYQQQDYAEAQHQFRNAIAVDPEAPAGHFNLAWTQLRLGDHQGAQASARQAQTLAPDHARFGRALADIEAAIE